ncbi:MAG TPA: c-type cytochrome [Geminicoccaceae bacterium]
MTGRSVRVAVLALAYVVAAGTASAAASPPPGAAACSGCHRPAGDGGVVPAIQGRPAAEIVTGMQAYRANERSPTVMNRIAKGFSDDEVQAIAAWLAEQR